ncbi:MAG: DoxX family protein [Opitutae bacterium]|nr:DoxX family protein [Opitutae bacterium]
MQPSPSFLRFVATGDSLAPVFLRLALGLMMFAHGAQKLLGWFGGYGFSGTMAFFTGTVGAPWLVGLLVILGEFFGGLLLLAGAGTRFVAASHAVILAGAAWHLRANGFFMNWFGNQKGEGFEFFLLALSLALALAVLGGGKWSVDARLAARG